jgi:predicted deacylase
MTLLEMGESRRVSREYVPLGVRGLRNIMKSMGMLDGDIELDDQPVREFTHFAVVHATRGGGLRLKVELDDEVKAGDAVAEIVDTFGETVETVLAPEDGFILRVMKFGSVATGAELVWVAN